MRMTLTQRQRVIEQLRRQLAAGIAFEPRKLRLNQLELRLHGQMNRAVNQSAHRFRQLELRLRDLHPQVKLAQARQRLEGLRLRLQGRGDEHLARSRSTLVHLAGRLHALSPIASLERGYSIARQDGQIVRDAQQVNQGQEIEVLLHQGWLRAEITKKGDGFPETIESEGQS